VAPYQLDARRCISYLTIENPGPIPEEFRAAIGNRIYGCDDCQLACPWNKYARKAEVPDFAARNGLDAAALVDLFAWTRDEFDSRLEGSAIRRIGHARWLRNIAVALGNAPTTPETVAALRRPRRRSRRQWSEHVAWPSSNIAEAEATRFPSTTSRWRSAGGGAGSQNSVITAVEHYDRWFPVWGCFFFSISKKTNPKPEPRSVPYCPPHVPTKVPRRPSSRQLPQAIRTYARSNADRFPATTPRWQMN